MMTTDPLARMCLALVDEEVEWHYEVLVRRDGVIRLLYEDVRRDLERLTPLCVECGVSFSTLGTDGVEQLVKHGFSKGAVGEDRWKHLTTSEGGYDIVTLSPVASPPA